MPSQDHLASSVVSPEPDWIKYLENDGTVGDVAFFSENLSATYAQKNGDIIGMALIKKDGQNLKLGDMYVQNGVSFIVLELKDKEKFGYQYINMRDKNELATLRGELKRSNFISLAAAY